MPTPVAHSCLGLSIGLAYILPRGSWAQLRQAVYRHRIFLVFAIMAANLPDMDYLPGLATGYLNSYHHYYTHTIVWTVMMAAGWFLVWRAFDDRAGWRELLILWLLPTSHLLADWVTEDGLAPYGMMLFWPLSGLHSLSPVSIFPKTEKLRLADLPSWHNGGVMVWEALVGLMAIIGVAGWKRRGVSAADD